MGLSLMASEGCQQLAAFEHMNEFIASGLLVHQVVAGLLGKGLKVFG